MSNRDEDAWRQIVEHYGDVPDFPDEPAAEVDAPEPEPEPVPELDPDDPLPDEAFVPLEPPPLPRPRGARLVAWLGVFGAPILLLLSLFVSYRLPSTVSALLVMWFLGSFLYLVWQMPKQRDDPWDNGARL